MKSKNLFTHRLFRKRTKRLFGIFLFFWICTSVIIGQPNSNYDPGPIAKTDINNLSTENTIEQSSVEFFETYKINPNTSFHGKLLNESVILITPSGSADFHKITLSAGEIVQVYKYFEKGDDSYWAIKHKNYFGFVKSIGLMALKDEFSTKYDTPPELISLIRPKYPKEARKKNITGSVIIKALINKKGLVEKTKVQQGIDQLNQSAIKATKKARFKPAEYKGKPVLAWIDLTIDFERQ